MIFPTSLDQCPYGYTFMDGECYLNKPVDDKMSRDNAVKYCKEEFTRSFLPYIERRMQWNNLVQLFGQNNISGTFWIDHNSNPGELKFCYSSFLNNGMPET